MANFSRLRSDQRSRVGLQTNQYVPRIRRLISEGEIDFTRMTTRKGQRLDQIAHSVYGDGRLWWVIAAASNIGWWLQVQEGTTLIIPTNIGEIEELF